MKTKKLFADVYLILILCLLYLPIALIIVFSFSGKSDFTFADGINLNSYVEMFSGEKTEKLKSALANTMIIAAISSVISTIFGTFAAIGIFYLRPKTKNVVLGVNQLPMTNSEIVMAVSLMLFFALVIPSSVRNNNIVLDFVVLILSHIAFCTPYVILSVMPRLMQMNPNLYEAALDLGATPTKALFGVIVPYVFPGVISGFVMSFTLSMDDFIITQMNKGDNMLDTLSTYIYADCRLQGLEPFWFAVFSIIFVVVLALLLLANIKKIKSDKGEQK